MLISIHAWILGPIPVNLKGPWSCGIRETKRYVMYENVLIMAVKNIVSGIYIYVQGQKRICKRKNMWDMQGISFWQGGREISKRNGIA